jgi:ATP-dependent DNA helicase RecG
MLSESQNIEYKESWRDEYLKWICGFANAQGGRLYIGVNDNKEVVGLADTKKLLEDIPNKIVNYLGVVEDVNLLAEGGKEYIEIVVTPSSMPIAYRGTYHYRSGSTKQELKGVALQNFILKKMGISWDNMPLDGATLDDIDRKAIDYFLRKGIAAGRVSGDAFASSTEAVLRSLNLMTEDGKLKQAAILLFGKDVRRFFVSADYRIGRFGTSESDLMMQDVKEGSILMMVNEIIELLRSKYLLSPIHYEGIQRIEQLEIPEDVLREAICNAIVHRDYMGVHTQMKVYNDRITIWNDGKLPEGLDQEKLFAEHASQPRNRNIANVFYKAGFIENWGRGINKMREGLNKAGLKDPVIENSCSGTLLTIYRNVDDATETNGTVNGTVNDTVNDTVNNCLTERQLVIIKSMQKKPKITGEELMEILGVSLTTLRREISTLKENGYVQRAGSDKTGHWVVLQKPSQ